MRPRKRKPLPAGYTVAKEEGHGSYPWAIRYQGALIATAWDKAGTIDWARHHAAIVAKKKRAARKTPPSAV